MREANARQSFGGRAPPHSPHGFAPRKHSFALRKNYPVGYAVTCDQAFFFLFFFQAKVEKRSPDYRLATQANTVKALFSGHLVGKVPNVVLSHVYHKKYACT